MRCKGGQQETVGGRRIKEGALGVVVSQVECLPYLTGPIHPLPGPSLLCVLCSGLTHACSWLA